MDFDSPAFFYAGAVCLDFCNTFDHRHTPPKYDFLSDRETFVQWGRKAGILAPKRQFDSVPAARSFKLALQTRRLIFELFSPFTRSAAPKPAVIDAFSARHQAIAPIMALGSSPGGYRRVCKADDPVEQVECAVFQSASELLLSNQTDRIRECQGCGWFFFDATRNGSRRWCTMDICGNRAKASRHYARTRRTAKAARP